MTRKMNTLLNIDTQFGKTDQSRKGLITSIAVPAIFIILWVVILLPLGVPLWPSFVLAIILFVFLLAVTVGQAKKRKAHYLVMLDNHVDFKSKLVRVNQPNDEYYPLLDGRLAITVKATLKGYLTPQRQEEDIEHFLDKIYSLPYKVFFINDGAADNQDEEFKNVNRYVDKEYAKKRFDFYMANRDYTRKNSSMYTVYFVFPCKIEDYETVSNQIDGLVAKPEVHACFNSLKRCNKMETLKFLSTAIKLQLDISSIQAAAGYTDLDNIQVLGYDLDTAYKFEDIKTERKYYNG